MELIGSKLPADEVQEVWECDKGHVYESPKPHKLGAVVCPRCVIPYKGASDITKGITKWNMKKVKERSRNGRLVNV